jgi:hypothetical protein
MYLQDTECKDVGQMYLTFHRVQCRALENAVMTFGLQKRRGISWLSKLLLVSQEYSAT